MRSGGTKMAALFEKLSFYFSYPILRYALIAGVLIALCASLLGVTLVLKRYSFIGDGLSHVAFGAVSAASVLQLSNNMLLVMPVTILVAVFLLCARQGAKIKGDAAIAMLSVGALGVGYLIMHVFGTSSNLAGDVCTTLFGSTSILTLTQTDVWMCVVMSVVVISAYLLFYNKIFAVTFDETFVHATGIRSGIYKLILAVITAVVIVLAMRLVGSLLISALIIFPALSAMRLFGSFRGVVLCSGVLSVVCALLGIFISILWASPMGATVVCVDIAMFGICTFLGWTRREIG